MTPALTQTRSWGRVLRTSSRVSAPAFLGDVAPALAARETLAKGLGRSYGDVCLNDGGGLIETEHLDRLIAADWQTGIVRAEAGLSIGELLRLCVPHGWFVPVTPGTKFVTLGGAVANDVHGKNHHGAGTFGCHVLGLGLQRSTGECLELSPDRNAEMFAATIGGLGLTGIITWVELRLVPIVASDFEVEVLRFDHLDAFFPLAAASADWPYTVAWVDCLAQGARLGRGLFSRGRPAAQGPLTVHRLGQRINVPVDAPAGLLGPSSVRAFNAVYARQPVPEGPVRVDYDKFLYPLDGIGQWNRLYGPRGFYQHQSCVPLEAAPRILARLLELTSEAGQGSFLVVLKLFGPRPSPGLLSFPREGATFALDLPHAGAATLALLNRMADIVLDAGGRLYPAKDATMAPWHFQEAYPQWRQLEELRDPGLKSDFWRRVTRKAA